MYIFVGDITKKRTKGEKREPEKKKEKKRNNKVTRFSLFKALFYWLSKAKQLTTGKMKKVHSLQVPALKFIGKK